MAIKLVKLYACTYQYFCITLNLFKYIQDKGIWVYVFCIQYYVD